MASGKKKHGMAKGNDSADGLKVYFVGADSCLV